MIFRWKGRFVNAPVSQPGSLVGISNWPETSTARSILRQFIGILCWSMDWRRDQRRAEHHPQQETSPPSIYGPCPRGGRHYL